MLVADNPMRSRAILQLKQGYAKLAKASGYQRKSAKPWSEGDVRGVLAYLEVKLAESTGIDQLLHIRDALVLALLWETKSRGANAGAWRLANLRLQTGR